MGEVHPLQAPPPPQTPAQIALSYLVARGLPQDNLGFLEDLKLAFASKRAKDKEVCKFAWKGDALLLPHVRWDQLEQPSYLQALLLKEEDGVWYKDKRAGKGEDARDKNFPSKERTGLEKTGAFYPLCSIEELQSTRVFWICEGFATGCALRILLEMAGVEGVVICGIDAFNLKNVIPPHAEKVRFFADMDASLTGQKQAIEAAQVAQEIGIQDVRVLFHAQPLNTLEVHRYLAYKHLPPQEKELATKPPKPGIDALDLFQEGWLICPKTLDLLRLPDKKLLSIGGQRIFAAHAQQTKQYRGFLALEKKKSKQSKAKLAQHHALSESLALAEALRVQRAKLPYVPSFPAGRHVFFDGTLGAGKTTTAFKEIEMASSSLLATYRRTLIDNQISRCPSLFDYRERGEISKTSTREEAFEQAKHLVTCIDSLPVALEATGRQARALVIADEAFATMASCVTAKRGEHETRIADRVHILRELLEKSHRSLFLEAALHPHLPTMLKTLTEIEDQIVRVTYDQERGVWFDEDGQETSHQTPAVWAEYISKHPYTWRFSPTEEGLIAHMKAAFLRGEKLAIFTTTQSDVEGLARALKKLRPEAKGLLVHGGLGLEERRHAASQEAWAACDFAIYNGAAESGLSVDIEGFDATYVLGKHVAGIGWTSLYQGAARVRKTRTMEIRAWIDNQARPVRTASEIAQEIVEEDHAFCQMLRHTLGNDATWGYRADDEQLIAFVAEVRAAQEQNGSERLTKLLQRLAFEDADLGVLPVCGGQQAKKELIEAKKELVENAATRTAQTAKVVEIKALEALSKRVNRPEISSFEKERKALLAAQEKALQYLHKKQDSSTEAEEIALAEDGKAALDFVLEQAKKGDVQAKAALKDEGQRALKLCQQRARDAAQATREEIEAANAAKVLELTPTPTAEDAKNAKDRLAAARLFADAIAFSQRPDLYLKRHVGSCRRSKTDEIKDLLRTQAFSHLLLVLCTALPEVAAAVDLSTLLFAGGGEPASRTFDKQLYFQAGEEDGANAYKETYAYLKERQKEEDSGKETEVSTPLGREVNFPREGVWTVSTPHPTPNQSISLLDKALRLIDPSQDGQLSTPPLVALCQSLDLSFAVHRVQDFKNNSYNIQRDLGILLQAFGIKRERKRVSVGEGRRAWAYRVDVESLRTLLEAALPMLKKLSRRSASNPRTEVESHLETQLERSRRSMEVQGLGVLGPCEYAGDPFAGRWEEAEDPWA